LKFVTIGYGDQAGYDRTEPAVRNAAHAHDARLKAAGAVIGIAVEPVQVRMTAACRRLTAGYMRSSYRLLALR